MKKKIIAAITLVITFFVLALCVNANTETFDSGDYSFTINNDGETVTLTRYLGNGKTASVPQTVEYNGKTYTVNKIGASSFMFSGVSKIYIPEGVTSIGAGAFEFCESLTEISLPDSLTFIGGFAFSGCESLKEITIPDGITSIGNCTFYWCYNLRKVSLPDSITSIGRGAFSLCRLAEITLPNGITTIGELAFEGCFYLSEITIPEKVISIGDEAFYGCHSLKSVYFYGDVPESWGNKIFSGDSESELILYYIAGKERWTTPQWTAPDGSVYKTATFTNGDVSGDGKIDLDDVVMLLRHISNTVEIKDSKALVASDVTADGVLNMDDVVKLLRFVSKAIPSLR